MSDLRALYRQSSHYLAGRVVVMLLGLVSFPVFTRLFSVEDYGLMNLVVKTVSVFVVFSKMGVQNSVMRFYQEYAAQKDKRGLRTYYSTLYFAVFGFAAAATVIFDLAVWWTPISFLSPLVKELMLLGSGLIFIRGIYSVLLGFWRIQERTLLFNVVDAANKIGAVILIVLFAFTWERSVRAFLGGSLLVEGASILIASFLLWNQGLIAPSACERSFFKKAVAYGAPLILYELFGVILGSADRFLVQFYLGARQLGYYSAAYNISSSLQDSIISPLNLALFPIYMRLWVTKGKEETQTFIATIFNHFALASIGIIALVTLISRDGVILLATEKFQKAQSLVPLLVAALLVGASHFFIDPGLLIYRKTAVMARIAVYSTIVNVGLNVLLLPKLALLGAGLATLLTYLFMIILTIRPAFSLLPIALQLDRLARYAAAAAVAVFVLRGLQLTHVFLDLLLKTTLCTVGYLALVWMLDSKFRTFVASWLGLGFRPNVVAEMGSQGKSI